MKRLKAKDTRIEIHWPTSRRFTKMHIIRRVGIRELMKAIKRFKGLNRETW